jgi:hypothetical protein
LAVQVVPVVMVALAAGVVCRQQASVAWAVQAALQLHPEVPVPGDKPGADGDGTLCDNAFCDMVSCTSWSAHYLLTIFQLKRPCTQ